MPAGFSHLMSLIFIPMQMETTHLRQVTTIPSWQLLGVAHMAVVAVQDGP